MREVEQRMQGVGALPVFSIRVCHGFFVRFVCGVVMIAMRGQAVAPRGVMRQFVDFANRSQYRHQGHTQRKQAQRQHA